MPRGPNATQDKNFIDEYSAAWQATMKLLREGQSLSGHEPNCVFLNCRGPRFANVSAITGLDFDDDGRALGVTDWDHDGDLDVWFHNRTGPRLRLMRNETISRRPPPNAQFVAFRLQGTVSNRDAIGARVTVVVNGTHPGETSEIAANCLVQTLSAGDAYISQSSKWLHFGLGDQKEISEVNVRWPNGRSERFSDIHAGRRYRLVEGTGRAVDATLRRGELALAPSDQKIVEPTQGSRTVLSSRLPMPILRYQTSQQPTTEVIRSRQRPLLITLWATWCAPCIEELKAFTDNAARLQDAELDILALSLDGLDPARPGKPRDAQVLLERMGFPFSSGVATRELLDKLEVARGILLNRRPQLAPPTSFLLDARGALAVIYHGKVEVALLRKDLDKLDSSIRERRNWAIPMPGRWSSPPRSLLLSAVARLYKRHGYTEDYARYLALDAEMIEQQRNQARSAIEQTQWNDRFAAAHFDLALALVSAGEVQEAVEHFQDALEAQPDHADALINLGALLAQAGQLDAAIKRLRRAVQLEPDSLLARTNLAAALTSQGDFKSAAEHYRFLVEKRAGNGRLHSRFARVLLELGDLAAAAEHFRLAIQLDPRDSRSTLCLAWLRATCPSQSLRDGSQAVELAERLHAMSGGKDPMVHDVLSASYAEQGDFARACESSTRALGLLKAEQRALRTAVRKRLTQYEAERPYRDADGKYP